MAALGMMAEAANARLLHERVEGVREQLAQLQNQEERYDAVAETLNELPDGLSHLVIAPGKIVRSNEVLAHLEDDVFSWRSATQDVEIIASKQEGARPIGETGLALDSDTAVKLSAPPAARDTGGESAGAGGHDDACG
ncbi:hypothetical protein PF010_g9770 [Phytophthora fragariae]|uniref:Uncharacterized protein n=1 Tax=Phytophthora fragariae TaxID=53985 RepID=A0A6G0LAW9_9STRA|nr:hypothetical protein PF010_g9770 [Phytophthora fragariae]